MGVIQLGAWLLYTLILLYTIVLLARLVLEWIPVFNRSWRPRGFLLVVAEAVYTVTDPPLRAVRRFVKPVRLGGAAIDFGFAIVMLLCFMLMSIMRSIASL